MKIHKCYSCGFCCTQSICGYGKWNAEKHQCEYLTADTKCGKYEEIVEKEKGTLYPMMGWGCSSPLCNDMRDAKMESLVSKDIGDKLDFSPDFDKLFEK